MKKVIFVLSLCMCLSANATEFYDQEMPIDTWDIWLSGNDDNDNDISNINITVCGNNISCTDGIVNLGLASATTVNTFVNLTNPIIDILNFVAHPFDSISIPIGGLLSK